MPRDLLAETLWINGRAVTVTPELLAEALTLIEQQVGVGQALEQSDIADTVVQLLRARQIAESGGEPAIPPRISIRGRHIAAIAVDAPAERSGPTDSPA